MRTKQRGLTLVEIALSTLIVGVMLVGAMETMGAIFRSHRMKTGRLIGPSLAHELMGEILSLPYDDPEHPGAPLGTNTGESNSPRAAFDDVDDYNNWSAANAQDKNGTAYPDYTGWQRAVRVTWVNPSNVGAVVGNDQGVKHIEVTVTDPDSVVTKIDTLRFAGGSVEQKPAVDKTAVTWQGAELQLGGADTVHAGVQLSNQTYDAF